MEAHRNPFTPENGKMPPAFVGRRAIIERANIALDRIRTGSADRNIILYGLRGVGKTVVLHSIRLGAKERGFQTVTAESPETWSLPAMLLAPLCRALELLGRTGAASDPVRHALRAAAGFAKLRSRFGDLDVVLDVAPDTGLADSGDLARDLAEFFIAAGEAAAAHGTAIVIFIDDLQSLVRPQFAALLSALEAVYQRRLPLTMVAAGLPQLLNLSRRGNASADHLLEFHAIDPLGSEDSFSALQRPIERAGAEIKYDALTEIVLQTEGYPYLLQTWGKHCWNVATTSPITLDDVHKARRATFVELDESFFGIHFERLMPGEKRYIRAIADAIPGSNRSRDIAEGLGRSVETTRPMRRFLITKGILFSASGGATLFTIPLFGDYVRRMTSSLS